MCLNRQRSSRFRRVLFLFAFSISIMATGIGSVMWFRSGIVSEELCFASHQVTLDGEPLGIHQAEAAIVSKLPAPLDGTLRYRSFRIQSGSRTFGIAYSWAIQDIEKAVQSIDDEYLDELAAYRRNQGWKYSNRTADWYPWGRPVSVPIGPDDVYSGWTGLYCAIEPNECSYANGTTFALVFPYWPFVTIGMAYPIARRVRSWQSHRRRQGFPMQCVQEDLPSARTAVGPGFLEAPKKS